MTALYYTLGVLIFVVRDPRVDRPARVRPPHPRQEVRRQGHPVVRGLRPDGLQPPDRRDRVRRQGDPARRLRQDRRHAPARQGRGDRGRRARRDARAAVQHRHVHPAHLRRPRGGVGARQARGLRPAVLQVPVVAEGRRDGRRPDGQHRDRLLPLLGRLRHRRPGRRRQGRAGGGRGGPVHRARPTRTVAPAPPRSCATTPAPPPRPGLEPGDRFVSFNGTPVTDWDQVQQAIRDNGDGTATIVVERDGEQVELEATTQVEPRPLDAASPEELTPVGFLGVMPVATPVYETGGPVYTLQQMGGMAVDTVQALVQLPVKVWGVAKAIVGLEERDPYGPVSVVGGGRLAGEVASHDDLPDAGQGRLPGDARRRLQLLHRDVQLPPAAAAGRRPHRRRPVGGHCAAASRGCAVVPTRGTSTWPGCCRSRTSSARRCSSWAWCSSSATSSCPSTWRSEAAPRPSRLAP